MQLFSWIFAAAATVHLAWPANAQNDYSDFVIAKRIALDVLKTQNPRFEKKDGRFEVFECEPYSTETTDISPKSFRIEILAQESALIQLRMDAAGIKKNIYTKALEKFENTVLADAVSDNDAIIRRPAGIRDMWSEKDYQLNSFSKQQNAIVKEKVEFYREVEQNRKSLGEKTPEIYFVNPMCSAGFSFYKFSLSPANGRAWIISKFSFDLCRARGISAWDVTACDKWNEIDFNNQLSLNGRYVYIARWSNNDFRTGIRELGYRTKSNVVVIKK